MATNEKLERILEVYNCNEFNKTFVGGFNEEAFWVIVHDQKTKGILGEGYIKLDSLIGEGYDTSTEIDSHRLLNPYIFFYRFMNTYSLQ